MNFNFEINLDFINEDGSLTDLVKQQIIKQAAKLLEQQALKELSGIVKKKFEECIGNAANELLERWFETSITVTDRWGDELEKGSIKDLLKKRFDEHWLTKVDSLGRTDRCGGYTRIEWLIGKHINKHCEKFADDLATEVKKQVEEIMTDKLKLALGDEIVNNIGVPKIVKRLEGGS